MSSHLPRWFNELSGIFEKEQAGAIFGLLAACVLAPGRHILLCCDNTGAVATLKKGSGQSGLGRQLASVFWAVAAFYGCAVWVESVLSELNAADPPSRLCKLTSKPSKGSADYGPPNDFSLIFKDRMTLLQAQYGFTGNRDGFGMPLPCDNSFEEPGLSNDSPEPCLDTQDAGTE